MASETSRVTETATIREVRTASPTAPPTPDGPPAWNDVGAILRARPDLVAINSAVEQKPLAAG